MPAGLAVFDHHVGVNTTANIKFRKHAHVPGISCRDQVAENLVGDRLMETAFVPVGPVIEFQRFQFDAFLVRDVVEVYRGKIRLTGFWAQTSELGGVDLDV